MTCLCFKLIDLYWFYLLQHSNVHFVYEFIWNMPERKLTQWINKQYVVQLLKVNKIIWKNNIKILHRHEMYHLQYTNTYTILMLIFRRTNNKNCCQSSHKKYTFLKSCQWDEWSFQRKGKKESKDTYNCITILHLDTHLYNRDCCLKRLKERIEFFLWKQYFSGRRSPYIPFQSLYFHTKRCRCILLTTSFNVSFKFEFEFMEIDL